MPKKHNPTVAELKSLFLAHFSVEQAKGVKLQAPLRQKFGNEVPLEELEELALINSKHMDWMSNLLARRLKRNRHTTPLISPRDTNRLVALLINESPETKDLTAKERKMLTEFVKKIVENGSNTMKVEVLSNKNSYKEYWRWITTVLDLAAERGIAPTELLTLERETDEITRRMFTKRQFILMYKEKMDRFAHVDIEKTVLQPMLELATACGDKSYRRELEQELEMQTRPKLRNYLRELKKVMDAFHKQEIKRIYATA